MASEVKSLGLVVLFVILAFWAGISWEKTREKHLRPTWSVSHNDSYDPRNNNLENLVGSSDQIIKVDIVAGCVAYRKPDGNFMSDCIDACPLVPTGHSINNFEAIPGDVTNVRILLNNLNP